MLRRAYLPYEPRREESMAHEEKSNSEPILWVCTVCHNTMEGELPEKCSECGADKSEFDEAPKPGF